MDETHPSFPPKTLEKFLKMYWPPDELKIKPDALDLSNELLYLFAKEAVQRAVQEAEKEQAEEVDTRHVLKTIPGMLCDF